MATTNDIHDAAVVGGGIVGLAAALALAKDGHRVALIERAPPVRRRGRLGFDIRTVALTPASAAFVSSLAGDDVPLSPDDMATIRTMRVWEYDGAGSLTFECSCGLASVVENSVVTTGLWRAAGGRVDVFAPATVVGIDETVGHTRLTLEPAPGARLEVGSVAARLLVAADGENSVVRTHSGVAVRHDARMGLGNQRAVATVARTRRPHGNTAWQRFGRSGPIALLPLPDECHVAVIWSTSESINAGLSALDDAAFAAALHDETEGVADGFVAVDRRVSFPLRQSLAAQLHPTPRTLIIGDAARTLHPLAGQGVNLGLEDVRALAAEASAGGDLGAAGRWREFARARRMRSKAMIAVMRMLLGAYCGARAANPWMRLARNVAVRGIDASPMAKAQLVREAMGLGPFSDWSTAPARSRKGGGSDE